MPLGDAEFDADACQTGVSDANEGDDGQSDDDDACASDATQRGVKLQKPSFSKRIRARLPTRTATPTKATIMAEAMATLCSRGELWARGGRVATKIIL